MSRDGSLMEGRVCGTNSKRKVQVVCATRSKREAESEVLRVKIS